MIISTFIFIKKGSYFFKGHFDSGTEVAHI